MTSSDIDSLSSITASANPMRASDFLSTLGVNTRIPYTDGGYANLANVDADLNYLGITEVRDFISNGVAGSAPLSSYITLAKEGVKFTFESAAGGSYTTASLDQELSLIDQVNKAVPGSVTAIEGPNEINNQPITYNGVSGLQGAVDFQQALYAAVHSDPNLTSVSVDYFTGYDAGSVQIGPDPATTPGLADFDNQHPYPNNGNPPEEWTNPTQALPNESTGTGPAVYTETGYSTNGGTNGAVNADVQAKYTLDLLMDDAKDGIAKTYIYQLMDAYQPGSPQGDDGYGLFDPNNVPKEAATGIHDLTSILADNGGAAGTFTTSPLNYSIAGLPSTGNSMVIEKSDGRYDIVVWNEPQIWDEATGTEITAPTINVNVDLYATFAQVSIFDPLSGTTAIENLNNVNSVQLELTDHPLIIEVSDRIEGTGDSPNQIVFQNSSSGQVYKWQMNATSVIASGFVGNNNDPSWHVVATGDFSGNGLDDMLFQNASTGQVFEWQTNGSSVIASGLVGNNNDPSWHVVATGDFTGNGIDDMLFQNLTDGQIYEWQLNGTSVTASGYVGQSTDPAWQVVGTGDFTGNGIDDILLQNSATGQLSEWQMNGTTVVASGNVGNNIDPAWQVVGIGDFTGNGIDDVLFQNSSTGQVYEWEMNGTSVVASGVVGNNTDPTWQVIGTGDYNGNGHSDVMFQNINTGQTYEWEMNGFSVVSGGALGNNANPAWHAVAKN